MFSLSRIKNPVLTKSNFELPQKFSYSESSGGSYFGVFAGQEVFCFSINCYGDAKIFAAERQWADDQKISEIKEGLTIEFTSTQYDKVLKWLLSCGCTAIPQKPQELVEDWKYHSSEMYKAALEWEKTE